VAAAKSRSHHPKAFPTANLLGLHAVGVTFAALYLPGGTAPLYASDIVRVPSLAATRAGVAMLVSFLVFIVLMGNPSQRSDFARAFFMTHKAFLIALLYGLVLMGGASGVAAAVQALLYRQMSEKIYLYIGALAGFTAFTVFVGYFPDPGQSRDSERREVAQRQPRFVEILFGYIMVPIMLALTGVLLVWTGRILVTGTWPVFAQLSGIAAAYTLGGVWLHVMVTHHDAWPARFYRRSYPIAALVILAFEAWALLNQLGKSGLKTAEYYFTLVWVLAAVACVLLLIRKAGAHTLIIALTCLLAVFSVLPAVGYHALPVYAQTQRLQKLLTDEKILVSGQLIPAAAEPERAAREQITDAVHYLAYAEDAKLPDWFDKNLRESDVFNTKLGFAMTWPESDDSETPGGSLGTSLYLPAQAFDIGGYRWAVRLSDAGKREEGVTFTGSKGNYRIAWRTDSPDGIPTLEIALDDRVILKQSMSGYLDKIKAAYPPGQDVSPTPTAEDMSLWLETQEISALLILNSVSINVDVQRDTVSYWLNPEALYLSEK
jgi:hypothetical protein